MKRGRPEGGPFSVGSISRTFPPLTQNQKGAPPAGCPFLVDLEGWMKKE